MTRRTRIKFCGMTSPGDVEHAVAAGADAIGVIVAQSSRRVAASAVPAIVAAVPPFVTAVVVTVGETDADLAALARSGVLVQFSGVESSAWCEAIAGGRRYIKAFAIPPEPAEPFDGAALDAYPNALPLFDTRVPGAFGGTGRTFAWDAVAAFAHRRPVVISGGLTPGNVAACIRALRPYAVDVRSGIETDGRTDPEKMRAFVRAVRAADGESRDATGALGTVTVPAVPNV